MFPEGCLIGDSQADVGPLRPSVRLRCSPPSLPSAFASPPCHPASSIDCPVSKIISCRGCMGFLFCSPFLACSTSVPPPAPKLNYSRGCPSTANYLLPATTTLNSPSNLHFLCSICSENFSTSTQHPFSFPSRLMCARCSSLHPHDLHSLN